MKTFEQYMNDFANRKIAEQLKRERVKFWQTKSSDNNFQIVYGKPIQVTPKITIQFGGSVFFQSSKVDYISEFVKIFGLTHDTIDKKLFDKYNFTVSHFKENNKDDVAVIPQSTYKINDEIDIEKFLTALAKQLEDEPYQFHIF